MPSKPIRMVQLSDLHLFSNSQDSLLGVNTEDSLRAVIELLCRNSDLSDTDFIILSGDLTQDGSEAAYRRLIALLKPLRSPIYWIPGNHDDVSMITYVYADGAILGNRHVILKGWQFIFLNSQKPGLVEGQLDEEQLHFMQQCLKRYPAHHAVIVFHHQPIPVGSAWLDKGRLTNADQFWACVGPFHHVRAVLFGHVHQVMESHVHHVAIYSAPSTCVQFAPNNDQFKLDNLPPGYRWLDFFEDGHIETGIERVAHYIGQFDDNATGYE